MAVKFVYDTPETVNLSKEGLEVMSVSIDFQDTKVYVPFREGYQQGGGIIQVGDIQQQDALAPAEVTALKNAIASRIDSLGGGAYWYQAFQEVLAEFCASKIGKSGSLV